MGIYRGEASSNIQKQPDGKFRLKAKIRVSDEELGQQMTGSGLHYFYDSIT